MLWQGGGGKAGAGQGYAGICRCVFMHMVFTMTSMCVIRSHFDSKSCNQGRAPLDT